MAITIKSIDGLDLYVAENAADVRAALVEAAAKGADLRGADLRGADLRGADLQRAYLQGADLRGADLRDADLRGADLRDADLQRAYLQGADLRGADLRGADLRRAYLQRAYLQGADLRGAYLQGADLRGADLRGAYLQRAYLQGADLRGADLQRAYLQGAYLQGAYLQGAKNFDPRRVNNLAILREQVGPIRAYKLVSEQYESLMGFGILRYNIGGTPEVANANTDENEQCGRGINLATLPWVMQEWQPGRRILVVEFTAADIAAIPLGDGKFRVRKCLVVGEMDLAELGLVPAPITEPTPGPAAAAEPKKRTRKAAAK